MVACFSHSLTHSLVRKDPIFGALVGGNLERHQPTAKLLSVCTTLLLVCALEYMTNAQDAANTQQEESIRVISDKNVLDAGGHWSRMELVTTSHAHNATPEDPFSSRIFLYICLPYCVLFGVMASLLQFNPLVALMDPSKQDSSTATTQSTTTGDDTTYWYVVGYCLFAAIESFGSLAVASFWCFCNSTLSLHEAERFYGIIIALAQLGAILGSTMVTTHIWSSITLIVLACLLIVLHVIVMRLYSRRFPPSSSSQPPARSSSEEEPTVWSGVYPILRHNYLLLILGASCLYEVSLTCLNYQMTLLGYSRFEESDRKMSFKQFMGHYGQMVNVTSLFFSAILFPWFIRQFGLRRTIRVFPTLLFLANIVAFGALPGNLAVLFFSLSLLKAMTYSIHDPAKEILYIPTSNAIKFKSKFWIDVVGARVAKAMGSAINNYAGSVEKSIRVASAPSLVSAAALWWVCYKVGHTFDALVESGTIVGEEEEEDCRNHATAETYEELYGRDSANHGDDDDVAADATKKESTAAGGS
jgi:ATP/ADP translocase